MITESNKNNSVVRITLLVVISLIILSAKQLMVNQEALVHFNNNALSNINNYSIEVNGDHIAIYDETIASVKKIGDREHCRLRFEELAQSRFDQTALNDSASEIFVRQVISSWLVRDAMNIDLLADVIDRNLVAVEARYPAVRQLFDAAFRRCSIRDVEQLVIEHFDNALEDLNFIYSIIRDLEGKAFYAYQIAEDALDHAYDPLLAVHLGHLAFRARHFEKSVSLYRGAIDKLEFSEINVNQYIVMLNNIGAMYVLKSEPQKARAAYEKAITVNQSAKESSESLLNSAVYSLGLLYFKSEALDLALDTLKKAFHVPPVSPIEEQLFLLEANIFYAKNLPEEASHVIDKLKVRLAKHLRLEANAPVIALRELEYQVGLKRWSDALATVNRVREMLERHSAKKDLVDIAFQVSFIEAYVYQYTDPLKAETLLLHEISRFETSVRKVNYRVIRARQLLAVILDRLGKSDKAVEQFWQVMEDLEYLYGRDSVRYIAGITDYALYMLKLRKIAISIDHMTEALRLSERLLGIDHPRTKKIEQNLNELFLANNRS